LKGAMDRLENELIRKGVAARRSQVGDLWTETCLLITVTKLCNIHVIFCYPKGKGKAVPLQAWSGPEGSKKLRFPDFMTTAQDGGKVVGLTHRPPLSPGDTRGAHFC
jgi:hypothetical protein